MTMPDKEMVQLPGAKGQECEGGKDDTGAGCEETTYLPAPTAGCRTTDGEHWDHLAGDNPTLLERLYVNTAPQKCCGR